MSAIDLHGCGQADRRPVASHLRISISSDAGHVLCHVTRPCVAVHATVLAVPAHLSVRPRTQHARMPLHRRCSADCAGLTITKEGKCQYCKGETCEWASKNDLCILDGKRQCWSKKYTCKEAPAELGLPEGLGVCLEK